MSAAPYFGDGYYAASVQFIVSRWFTGDVGYYTVCGGIDGFVDVLVERPKS